MSVLLIAQADRVYGWNPDWFPKGGSSIPLDWLYVMIGLIALAIAWHYGMRYVRRLRRRLEPLRVYCRLAARLGLNFEQRYTLWKVARATGLANPMTLLICSQTLEQHTRQYVATLPTAAARQVERQLDRIHRRLFPATAQTA